MHEMKALTQQSDHWQHVTGLHEGHTKWSEPRDLGINNININTLILVSIRWYKYHGYNIGIKSKILVSESSVGIRDTILVSKIRYGYHGYNTGFICMILAEKDREPVNYIQL